MSLFGGRSDAGNMLSALTDSSMEPRQSPSPTVTHINSITHARTRNYCAERGPGVSGLLLISFPSGDNHNISHLSLFWTPSDTMAANSDKALQSPERSFEYFIANAADAQVLFFKGFFYFFYYILSVANCQMKDPNRQCTGTGLRDNADLLISLARRSPGRGSP